MVSEPVAYPSRRELRAAAARHARRRPERRASQAAGAARHASSLGDGFGRLVALTALGAAVPGASLVAGGRRRLGWVLVGAFVLGLGALAAVPLTGNVTTLGLKLATRPNALAVLAAAVVAAAVVWCAAILVGHVSLRRERLTTGQRVLSAVLVAALMGLVALPSATAARYAMAQRSLILTVFDEGDEQRDDGLAAPDTEAPDPWADYPRVNVLLLGSDAGADRVGTRTDTMIVASINTQTGDTVLFSLPRNLQGPIFAEGSVGAQEFPRGFYPSGRGSCPENDCHLNAVWSWGERNADLYPGTDQPGLAATREAISGVLGLQLDYYAIVDLQGFEDLVNAIGGLEINVERRLPIGGIDAQGNSVKPSGYIEPGRRVLSGFEALWYARSRAGSDDYDRMKRQRCTIAAAVDQAEPVKLARAFPDLASSAERNIQTDVRASELDAFVELALRVKGASLRSLPFTNEVINTGNPDYDAIHELVQTAIEPPPAPTAPPTAPPTGEPAPEPPAGEPTAPPTEEPAPDEAVDVEQVCG